jgi:hydroxymethylpyrimidine pyrophosphatase-like HAD family hydrolase
VTQRVKDAITAALQQGYQFFPATGKSRAGMLNTLGTAGAALTAAGAPGVFLQGLIVYGTGPEGAVIFERVLNQAVADKTVQVYFYIDNCTHCT